MRPDTAQCSGYGRSVDAKVNGDTVGIHPQQVQVCGLLGDCLVNRHLREFGHGCLERHLPLGSNVLRPRPPCKEFEPAKGAAGQGHSFPAVGDTLLLIPQQIKNVPLGRNAWDVSSHGEQDRHVTCFV